MNTSTGAAADAAAEPDFPATNNACAACKFQRRKCSLDCPLAPFFPANRLQDFQNVRRLFGVKNVLKTLANLDQSERCAAAECMIFEANCRANDPAGGCYRVIASLQQEIMVLEAQRRRVLLLLRVFRPLTAAEEAIGGGGAGKGNLSSDFGSCGLKSVESLIKEENGFGFDLDLQNSA